MNLTEGCVTLASTKLGTTVYISPVISRLVQINVTSKLVN